MDAQFDIGAVVAHEARELEGVIGRIDQVCAKQLEWSQKHRPGIKMGQPWYVVVCTDGKQHYFGESELTFIASNDPLDSAYIDKFFTWDNGYALRED